MDQNSWNVVGMQLEVLERSWNIQEWTKNFHSNCIPVHSSSSVIGVVGISNLQECHLTTSNLPGVILAYSSALAPECSSNVVRTQ